MEKNISGKAWVFGNNIDTDQIYPGIYVELTEGEDIKKHAMGGSAEPRFAQEFRPGEIIVAGTNFGCGSSREHAAITLKEIGIGAVLAESFGRIFFRNAINLGLPVITCKGIHSAVSKGDFLKVDLQNGKILNETTGKELEAEPLGEYVLNILQSGGIKPLVKKQLLGK
jgi:3-isopropylmalate/(R)-2-methylmalate dehydratase small subunit